MAVSAEGKINRIYPSGPGGEKGCFISLHRDNSGGPKNNYFFLDRSHYNYTPIFTLALSAAEHGYTFHIRTVSDINPNEYGMVEYTFVEW